MVLLEFNITPLGGGESVGAYVARAVDVIDRSGLNYQLHAMGTTVEGELDQVLAVMQGAIEELAKDCQRISVSARIDYRAGRSGMLSAKPAAVEQRLGRKLKT
ncbi:MAG TPA: MTH1187 family thiamine-binding protein [Pirellulales bacterium]|nr:MTH1187 family thiamine-binding protein [Pirellulales bacterium]